MSVPVPQRTQGELEVNTRARILCVYTFKILENEKWFPKSQTAFITKLQDCVVEIQALCWEANNIKVDKSAERYQRRIDLQDQAAEKCNRMMMLIETAKPLFHLNSYHLVKRMEAYYKSLWEDNKHDAHPGKRTDCG